MHWGRFVRPRIVATASIGLLAVGAAGCDMLMEQAAEKATETALEQIDGVEGLDIDTDSGGVSIETDEGSFSTEQVDEVPEQIAALIDLPSGFEPAQATEVVTGKGEPGITVSGPVEGAVEAVADEIDAALEAAGLDDVERHQLDASMPSWQAQAGEQTLQLQLLGESEGSSATLTAILLSPAE